MGIQYPNVIFQMAWMLQTAFPEKNYLGIIHQSKEISNFCSKLDLNFHKCKGLQR